jgi:hypothetical protein
MQLEFHYHRNSNLVVQHDAKFQDDYKEIIDVLESISEQDLIAAFNQRKLERDSIKSLSEPINLLIRQRLVGLGWASETGIFSEPPYNDTNSHRWRLDFSKNLISVEVAFNHGEAIAHNIMKPVLASEKNHVVKEIDTELGIIISATDLLKKTGNFDSAVGSFEKFKTYFKPYNNLVPTPIVLIGLKETTSFKVNKRTKLIELIP